MRRHVVTLAITATVVLATSIAFAVPGDLDTTFGGGDGKVTTDFDADVALYDAARDVAAAPGGRIVAVGVGQAPNYDFAIARYLPNGDLDTSFGGDGKVTTDFFGQPDWAYAVEILPDGKILVVGSARSADNSDDFFALARYRT
ncbi:MAG TPA: delta-60 repeat domain-containing protein, partial [Actinomycetota bacterium]|nr:delta-60 repeat domain-containing protein [Actinomycetota bacterium]